jgi:DNA-binding Lrp family transcriptional regulator
VIKSSSDATLDNIDKTILQILQTDGRISHVELGQHVNLSSPAVHARIKRLEQAGYIRQCVTLLDHEMAGYDILCFISVRTLVDQTDGLATFQAAIDQIPEVLECHHVTGEFDYLLKVVARNRKELQRFIVDKIIPIPGVTQIHTSVVLAEIKSTTALPIK